MRRLRTIFFSAAWVAVSAPAVFGQSLLEQLEKKVRDGLELAAPAKPADSSESELPAPTRQTPPPPPTAAAVPAPGSSSSASGRASTSILERPASNSLPPASDTAINSVPAADVQSETLPDASAIYLGLEAESVAGGGIGARVVSVTPNSPAWRAGFKVNDVIQAIDGYAIANLDTIVDRLALRRPGDPIKVLLRRGNQNVELTAVLQSAAVAQRIQGASRGLPSPPVASTGHAWMGLVVADLSTAFRNQFGLKVYRAAAVTNVAKGSPADLVNIRPGDAIIAVEMQPIESARELLDWMLTKRPGERVSLTVMRGTRTTTMEITLGTDPQFVPTPPPRQPTLSGVFAAQSPVADVALEGTQTSDKDVALRAAENSVPVPLEETSPALVEELQRELRSTRQQVQWLEQRIAELEKLIKSRPQ